MGILVVALARPPCTSAAGGLDPALGRAPVGDGAPRPAMTSAVPSATTEAAPETQPLTGPPRAQTAPGPSRTTGEPHPAAAAASAAPFPLLRLPLEIRLQVYECILRLGIACAPPPDGPRKPLPQTLRPMPMGSFDSNVHQAPLYVRPVTADEDEDGGEGEGADEGGGRLHRRPLLPADRPVGRALPAALLATCRQVYREARTVAFTTSEFVFLSVFSSGLATAHAFVVLGSASHGGAAPRLQPWQRDSLQHMRLEIAASASDMGWDALCAVWAAGRRGDGREQDRLARPARPVLFSSMWLLLCQSLARGLRTLRLQLAVVAGASGVPEDWAKGRPAADAAAAAAAAVADSPLVRGLVCLAALRQLEIELLWPGLLPVARDRSLAAANVAWCAAVEAALNAARGRQRQQAAEARKQEDQDAAVWNSGAQWREAGGDGHKGQAGTSAGAGGEARAAASAFATVEVVCVESIAGPPAP